MSEPVLEPRPDLSMSANLVCRLGSRPQRIALWCRIKRIGTKLPAIDTGSRAASRESTRARDGRKSCGVPIATYTNIYFRTG